MDNYFISQLEAGNEYNVCFMVHNAYWHYLDKLNRKYEGCSIDIYGSSMSYFHIRNRNRQFEYDYDLIIISSAGEFNKESDWKRMEKIAIKISQDKNKRVTIGYNYFLPKTERTKNISEIFKVESFDCGEASFNQDIPLSQMNDDVYSLLALLSQNHDELEQSKKLIKK